MIGLISIYNSSASIGKYHLQINQDTELTYSNKVSLGITFYCSVVVLLLLLVYPNIPNKL